MRYHVLLLTLLLSNTAFTQDFTLSSTNPEPRIGQEFEVKGYLNDTITDVRLNNILKIRNIARIEGINQIGPLTIIINGKTYKSDTLTLNVIEELDESEKGIWVRTVNFQEKNYIILEQNLEVQPRRTAENSVTFDNEGIDFAEIDMTRFDSNKIKIWNPSSYSTPGYKRWIYRYDKKEEFEPIPLEKKYFKNLPKKIKLKNIILN